MNKKTKKIIFELIVIGIVLVFSIPLYLIIINTFKTNQEIIIHPLSLPGIKVGFDNVWRAFQKMNIVKSYGVTLSIGAMTIACSITFSSLAAYAVARIKHPFFNFMYWLYLSCILLPIQSAFIPVIFVLKNLHLYNNLFGISMVYIAIISPFCIFMYSGFIRGITYELEESAFMDGSTVINTFFKIIFPLLKPVTATMCILQFIYVWNDLLLPLVILNGNDYPTVSLGLYKFFAGRGMADLSLLFGGISLVLVPTIVVFISFQRFFVKGLSSGAIKG
jgi:raffinose/stachyose/melibiose transport system permease protein